MKTEGKNSFIKYITILIKWRLFIIKFVIIVTVISIIISLLLPQKFTATATILPPNPEQEAMLGMLISNIPGGLTGLTRLGGSIPGMSTTSDLFAALMRSSRIKSEIIRKYNLMKEFKVKTMSDAGKMLDKITNIEVTGEGIISVSITYKNKYLAADIANSYIEELDKFNKETAMTTGKKYRIFIEERLKETADSLKNAEESLRNFQEKYRTTALDAEIQSAIETIAKLKSEIILREVQKGALSFENNINNPYIQNIEQELKELKKQLAKIEFGSRDTTKKEFGVGFSVPLSGLPEVYLEYARLLRNVKVHTTVYELLTQQYEQAKIMEAKDTPTVQFLDRASPPEKKSYPRRSAIVIFSFVASLLIGIFLACFLEYYQHLKQTPEWQNFYTPLQQDYIKFKKLLSKIIKRKS
jgi:uncharacterized protein involved in exopolysaccharide biosynthesis